MVLSVVYQGFQCKSTAIRHCSYLVGSHRKKTHIRKKAVIPVGRFQLNACGIYIFPLRRASWIVLIEDVLIKWNWDTLGMFWEQGPSLVGEKFPVCKCLVSSSGGNEKYNLGWILHVWREMLVNKRQDLSPPYLSLQTGPYVWLFMVINH